MIPPTLLPHEEDSTRLAECELAVARDPTDADARARLGIMLWSLYQLPRADGLFQDLRTDPRTSPDTLQRIAKCYFQVGRFGEAAELMAVAVEREPRPTATRLTTWAWAIERDQRLDESRETAERALAVDPAHGPAARLVAHLDRRKGDFEIAAARLESQLTRYPSDFDWGLRYELAAVLDRLGRYDPAWQALCLAKSQLAAAAAGPLRDAYAIRRRQVELVRNITEVDLRRWRSAAEELMPRRICFLAGFPRSGTTLLEQILASHQECVDTDETGILSAQFVAPIVWKAPDVADAIVELRSFAAPQLEAGRAAFWEMTENHLGTSIGNRLLIEKDPLMSADFALPLRLFPEAKVLIALRDPRDVVLSYLFTMVPLNWSSAAAIDVTEACRFYADTMRHWLWWKPRLDWPCHETRYEGLIVDPIAELQAATGFLELTWEPSILDERRRSERKAVGTPTYDDITKPLYTRAVGRWRNYARHLEPGLALLEPMIRALGYD